MTKHGADNHANQMNPNNDAYWQSRGFDERPEGWDERTASEDEIKDRQEIAKR